MSIDFKTGTGIRAESTVQKTPETPRDGFIASASSLPKKAILLITNYTDPNPRGGRAMLCGINLACLQEIYNDKLMVLHIPIVRSKGFSGLLRSLSGYIDGVNLEASATAVSWLQRENITSVFIDGSNLGTLAMAIKRACPEVTVTTFFHNVEVQFFLGSFRLRPNLRTAAILFANYIAERRSANWSDQIICLNRRDSEELARVYGRRATHISALAVENRFPVEFQMRAAPIKPYVLFVGGAFYGNLHGIRWYAKEVAASVSVTTIFVGKGLEPYRKELEAQGNLVVIGEVDDLSTWYLNALLVVAPIFDGSGMKTKVAEALMYGKKVIGTEESFMGYEATLPDAGWVCKDSAEFIAAIEQAKTSIAGKSDPLLRALYKEHYSKEAACARLSAILCGR